MHGKRHKTINIRVHTCNLGDNIQLHCFNRLWSSCEIQSERKEIEWYPWHKKSLGNKSRDVYWHTPTYQIMHHITVFKDVTAPSETVFRANAPGDRNPSVNRGIPLTTGQLIMTLVLTFPLLLVWTSGWNEQSSFRWFETPRRSRDVPVNSLWNHVLTGMFFSLSNLRVAIYVKTFYSSRTCGYSFISMG